MGPNNGCVILHLEKKIHNTGFLPETGQLCSKGFYINTRSNIISNQCTAKQGLFSLE
jgi:hypothetical protein